LAAAHTLPKLRRNVKTKSNATRTKKICNIRFCQNIKLSRHTSASSAAHQCAAAHSLGNTALGGGEAEMGGWGAIGDPVNNYISVFLLPVSDQMS